MASIFPKTGTGAQDGAISDAARLHTPQALPRQTAEDAEARRLGLTCYARAAFFVHRYLTASADELPPVDAVTRVVETLVDLSETQRAALLSLTIAHGEADYLVFHHVNAMLMAIAFARELGLQRSQIRDVGLLALLHGVGGARLPRALIDHPGALNDAARACLERLPGETMLQIFREKSASTVALRRIVLSEELCRPHATARRDDKGVLLDLAPAAPRGVYAELISICCAFDALRSKRPYRAAWRAEDAMLLMWSELRERFDADLLKVFMRVMLVEPIKLQGKMASTLRIG